ncbi:MAG: S-layer homology domain-containing protein, partial [Oscillospiraceae bacterium]|nr:S-layer homology domain-containing protein [Oscillospiraceae bacterium]
MKTKTNTRRLLALVLTFALMCTLTMPALADGTEIASQPVTEDDRTAWRTLDVDAAVADLQDQLDALSAAAEDESVSDADVIAAYDEAAAAYEAIVTNNYFAYWDYLREPDEYADSYAAINSAYNTAKSAYREAAQTAFAAHQDAFVDYLGEVAVERILSSAVYSDAALELMDEETALVSEYNTAISQDEADYEAIGEIYIKLLSLRKELAQNLGYDSYAEYAYTDIYGRNYTVEEAAALCREVLEQLEPIYSALYYSDVFADLDTSPVWSDLTQSELETTVKPQLGEISDTLTELFEYMTDNDLLDMEDLAGSLDAGCSYYLPSYNSAYIYLSENYRSGIVFARMFGSFSRACLSGQADDCYDVTELYSQGLEALYAACAESEEAAAYIYSALLDFFDSVVYGAFYSLFELEAYSVEEPENLTVEELNKMYADVLAEFDYEVDDGSEYSWCETSHLFEFPCCCGSFMTSGLNALELIMLAAEDFSAASEKYMTLLTQPYINGYSAAVTAAGLTDMLSDGAVETLAADLEDYIYNLEYDYMASQGLALTGTAEIGFADSDEDEYAVGTELEVAYTVEQEDAELAIQWYRDGVEIEDATEASYTLTPDDFGTTLSVAVSDAGGAYFGALKDEVELAAIKPYITASTSVSSGKITVTFSAEGCGSEVTSYTVKIEYDGVESKSKTFSEAGSYTFTGLLSDLEYDVIISAKNAVGTSTKKLSVTPKSSNAGGSGGGATSIISSIFSGTTTTTSSNPFTDVDDDSYYYDAVLWAVENDITSGTTASTFSPEDTCTRAQAVTFLWRAAGSPSVNGENSFDDVSEDDYYYTAVLWALQNGITTGTSDTAFSPNGTCTRAEIVTFLYRYSGKTAAAGSDFADVAADAWYASAVSWAVDGEITNGTGENTFSPNDNCTRAQIVTFLYRAES